jgi:hypothetical protein
VREPKMQDCSQVFLSSCHNSLPWIPLWKISYC